MKKLFCLIFLAILSCSTTKNNYCFVENGFEYSVVSSDLSKVNKKIILNNLTNNSNIKYRKNSDLKIVLNIGMKERTSLVSSDNSTLIESITFTTEYKIYNKKNFIADGKIIIIDDSDVFDNRFANYSLDSYVIENFSKNLNSKLENKIEAILKQNEKNCSVGKI